MTFEYWACETVRCRIKGIINLATRTTCANCGRPREQDLPVSMPPQVVSYVRAAKGEPVIVTMRVRVVHDEFIFENVEVGK